MANHRSLSGGRASMPQSSSNRGGKDMNTSEGRMGRTTSIPQRLCRGRCAAGWVCGAAVLVMLCLPAWATEPLPSAPGDPVDLMATPVAGTLSQPGWQLKSYPMPYPDASMTACKGSIATLEATGGACAANVTGEPEMAYLGASGLIDRPIPGFVKRQGESYYGFVAKGWINFPEAGHYSLGIMADDEGELSIGGTALLSAHYTQTGSGDVNGGRFIDLNVPTAGAYPIQFVWYQGWGDAWVTLHRRVGGEKGDRMLPLGSVNPESLADQPMIYGLLDGKPAPDTVANFTPIAPFAIVNLDPGQKVGDVNAGTGEQVFTTKMITCPWIYYSPAPGYNLFHSRNSGEEQWSTVPFRFLDFLGDANHGTVKTAVINYNNGGYEGILPNGVQFPLPNPLPPTNNSHFAMRAEGFVTFKEARTYYIGMSADLLSHLHVGKQMVASFQTQWWTTVVMALNVKEAGTYPIRMEYAESDPGGHLELWELTPAGVVPVNGPGSTIIVHETSSSGAYNGYIPHGSVIPADRKVADVGAGGESGWTVKMGKSDIIGVSWIGTATNVIENDLFGNTVASSLGTDTPDFIDYVDAGEVAGRFGGLLNWGTRFSNALPTGNDFMAASATGYIEFPAAGDYGIETSSDDGAMMWIGGEIVQCWPGYGWSNAPQDNVTTSVHIDAPGIYDIRVEYTDWQAGSLFTVWQQLPDGSAALINSSQATVHVYRTLNAGNPNSRYHNPVRIPAASKVAELNQGKTPGIRAQMVRFYPTTLDGPNYHGGAGHDSFWSLESAVELLKSVLDNDPIAKMNQQGYLLGDQVLPYLWTGDGCPTPAFPGVGEVRDWIAGRFTGYIGLKKGGHLLCFMSDDGWTCTIGGQNISRWGGVHGADWYLFYAYAEEDGLYPIRIDYYNAYGGQAFVLLELRPDASSWFIPNWPGPNWPTAGDPDYVGAWTTLYAEVNRCGIPFADGDGDGDVDQVDFGLFQVCLAGAETVTGACLCYDSTGDSKLDITDFDGFMKCFTGPAIKWTQEAYPECKP